MIKIHNMLNERLIINLEGGKSIDLLAKGIAKISEKELESPHLQAFIMKGNILIEQVNPSKKGESDTSKKVEKTEEIDETKAEKKVKKD